jgi:hypothetical protein
MGMDQEPRLKLCIYSRRHFLMLWTVLSDCRFPFGMLESAHNFLVDKNVDMWMRTLKKALESGYFIVVWDLLEFCDTTNETGQRLIQPSITPFVLSANAFLPTTLSFWFSTISIPCASRVFCSSVRFMSTGEGQQSASICQAMD